MSGQSREVDRNALDLRCSELSCSLRDECHQSILVSRCRPAVAELDLREQSLGIHQSTVAASRSRTRVLRLIHRVPVEPLVLANPVALQPADVCLEIRIGILPVELDLMVAEPSEQHGIHYGSQLLA